MEADQATKGVDSDSLEAGGEAEYQEDPVIYTDDAIDNETKPEDKFQVDDDSHDETRETSSRTSTRLVKFQLLETKSVNSYNIYLTPAFLYPRLKSKRNAQSHPQDRQNGRARQIRTYGG
jgi:hypothetical protein